MKKDKREAILDAIEAVKNGTFKATAIKLELEGELRRGRGHSGCDDCEGGYNTCGYCDGDYRSDCSECDGNGEVENPDATDDNDAYVECAACEGSGTEYCEFCDDGNIACENCEGSSVTNFGSESFCQDWLLERLVPLGLAKLNDGSKDNVSRSHTSYHRYIEDGAMKYAEFYRDGSVDSELTFTLSLEDPEIVFVLPKIIEIWKQLGEAVGNGIVVTGAGMHTAFLNDPDCKYWPGNRPPEARLRQFRNYRRSMSLLLPAVYFLSTGNEHSRSLSYRQPQVECLELNGHKYSAIAYRNSALEFRCFDTCYDNPEQILDNIVVMKNTMKYWRNKYRSSGVEKITPSILFGHDNGNDLNRFYQSETHLNLLNAGLERLKPEYLTIRELKQQRKFRANRATFRNLLQKQIQDATLAYREYEERFKWSLVVSRKRYEAELLEQRIQMNVGHLQEVDQTVVLSQVNQEVDQLITSEEARKRPLKTYVDEAVRRNQEQTKGRYALSA